MKQSTAILFGAVSEILADTLDHQAHGGDAANNPYFTPDDFAHVRELSARVEHLREKADCVDFSSAAAKLLNEEAQRFSALASEIAKLLAPWRAADAAAQRSIVDLVAALGPELHALTRTSQTDLLSETAIEQLLQPYGIDQALRAFTRSSIETYEPDNTRIATRLATLKGSFDTFAQLTKDHVGRVHALAESVKQRIAEQQLFLFKGVADDDRPTAIGRLDGRRNQFAFLKFSNPPSTDHFHCDDALNLFLNLAEDIESGAIVPRNASSLSQAYGSFMARFTEVDEMLSTALGFEQQARLRVTALEQVVKRLHDELGLKRVRSAVEAIRGSIANGRTLLTRAMQLAQSGEVTAAQTLRDRAMAGNEGLLESDDADGAIADHAARLRKMEKAFAELREEGEKQTSGWRGLIGGCIPALNSHDALLARLSSFHEHQASIGWGPGSELSRKAIRMVREWLSLGEVAGYEPMLRPWALISDSVDRARPRDVGPSLAFINALCAMAAAHDSLSEDERPVIHSALVRSGVPLPQPMVEKVIAGWRGITQGGALQKAIAQAIVDTDAISETETRESLLKELQRIARADEDVNGLEVLVYRGFFARIARLLHP